MIITEACDDGNVGNGDGCSSTCTKENGFTCTGAPSKCVTTCGDGKRAGSENCDDGSDDGLGCSLGCSGWQDTFTCSGGNPTTKDTCVSCATSCPTPPWVSTGGTTTTSSS